jgi:hypothetical protein
MNCRRILDLTPAGRAQFEEEFRIARGCRPRVVRVIAVRVGRRVPMASQPPR